MGERLHGEGCPLLEGEAARRDRVEHVGVVRRRGDDGDVRVVLGRRAHHRRAADVDLLDAVVDARARGDRLLERVQVHHDELEREDAEVLELLAMRVLAKVGQQAAVDVRVERLHPAVQRLREPRDVAHRRDRHAGRGDGARRSTPSTRSRCRRGTGRAPGPPARPCRRPRRGRAGRVGGWDRSRVLSDQSRQCLHQQDSFDFLDALVQGRLVVVRAGRRPRAARGWARCRHHGRRRGRCSP